MTTRNCKGEGSELSCWLQAFKASFGEPSRNESFYSRLCIYKTWLHGDGSLCPLSSFKIRMIYQACQGLS